jgi:dihydroorotate dehydrogenase
VLYKIIYRVFFAAMDAEFAHHIGMLAIRLLGATRMSEVFRIQSGKNLEVNTMGLHFDSPFGMAAGFDKNAVAIKPHCYRYCSGWQ